MAEPQQQQPEEEKEEQPQRTTVLDAPAVGLSQTERAAALARLLHHECNRLLQLYKERETFLSDHTPGGGRIVSLSSDSEEPSTEEKVRRLHAALRQCLGLLHSVIAKEEEEWGQLEGDFETMRQNVRARLENLLHSTKALLEGQNLEVTPDHQGHEEPDGAGGAFGLKMWTYRVLEELIHWADHAAETLHIFHTEKEGAGEV